jgi:periplasmic protein TonB
MMAAGNQQRGQVGRRRLGLLLAFALHGLVVAAIVSRPFATRAMNAAAEPITVSLLPSASPTTKPEPRTLRPQLEPQPPLAIEAPTLLTEPGAAPAPSVASLPAVRDPSPVDVLLAVMPPRFDAAYLQNPPPVYPALARRLREQGLVLLRVLVTIEGLPERVELKTSSGAQRLDQAAVDAVKHWRFVPARQGEQPVPAWVVVPIAFSLEA